MPDINVRLDADRGVITKFKDLGNGTFAPASSAETAAGYPPGAHPMHSSSANVANAAAVATLAAVAGHTTFVTGFEITGGGATVAALVVATLAGVLGGTQNFIVGAALGATVPNAPLTVEFSAPIPASAVNTAIVLTVPALGAGNTHSACVLHGFRI